MSNQNWYDTLDRLFLASAVTRNVDWRFNKDTGLFDFVRTETGAKKIKRQGIWSDQTSESGITTLLAEDLGYAGETPTPSWIGEEMKENPALRARIGRIDAFLYDEVFRAIKGFALDRRTGFRAGTHCEAPHGYRYGFSMVDEDNGQQVILVAHLPQYLLQAATDSLTKPVREDVAALSDSITRQLLPIIRCVRG